MNTLTTTSSVSSAINFKHIFSAMWKTVVMWHSRARQRQELAQLSDDQLKDIGITREAAKQESLKCFWKK